MDTTNKRPKNERAWTAEEDQRLAECIEVHGAKKWKSVATKAGLNRCERSCRLRWLNYLSPNIKRGSFNEQEDDLIAGLHMLLGNKWSLIAGRLPGRTDNEIKNYWNSHLSKRIKQAKSTVSSTAQEPAESNITSLHELMSFKASVDGPLDTSFFVDEFESNIKLMGLKGSVDGPLDTSFDVDANEGLFGLLDISFDVDANEDLFGPLDTIFDVDANEGLCNLEWIK